MKATVTIIIPMYNAEAYIEKCIRSLFAQTFRDIEIIVVDDGSTDISLQKCEALAAQDGRLRIIQQTNSGASAARNTALKSAEGEYIVFADADDYVTEDYVAELYDAIMQTGSDAAISRLAYSEMEHAAQSSQREVLSSEEAIVRMLLGKGLDSSVCCKMVKKNIVKETVFDRQLVVAEDMLFFYQVLSRCNKVAFSDKITYFYVQHEGSALSFVTPVKVKSMGIFEILIRECRNGRIRQALISKYISTCFHLLSLKISKDTDIAPLRNAVKKYRVRGMFNRYSALKVRIASLLSFFSFDIVVQLLSAKRR